MLRKGEVDLAADVRFEHALTARCQRTPVAKGQSVIDVLHVAQTDQLELAITAASSGVAGGKVRESFLPHNSANGAAYVPTTAPVSVTMFMVTLCNCSAGGVAARPRTWSILVVSVAGTNGKFSALTRPSLATCERFWQSSPRARM